VPERREEITTEGGLDVPQEFSRLQAAVEKFGAAKIRVSLFIDPAPEMIELAAKLGVEFVEFHTGAYANSRDGAAPLQLLRAGVDLARARNLRVNAGHGLTYRNVAPIVAMPQIEELNIGHSIISRAVFTGLDEAVREMKRLLSIK
jgi:pyridoxine 5-phosphate synthase